jgi:hypothetical protein
MNVNSQILQEVHQNLVQEAGMVPAGALSREHIVTALADRLAQIIGQGPDAFYRLMYRLDVSEKKIRAITGSTDVARKVAEFVYERQVQKVLSRRANTPARTPDNEDMAW